MLYEITLTVPGYDGTLQVLVEQVRRHEISILDVRLAPMAQQVAHFLIESGVYDFTPCTAVAGLMFVKSRALLPWRNPLEEPELDDIEAPPEEEQPTAVRERLMALYEVFREAAEIFRDHSDRMAERIRASQTRATGAPSFLDEVTFVDDISAYDLLLVMNQVLRRAERETLYRVKVDDKMLLDRRISEVFDFLLQRMGVETRFADIVTETTPRVEAVLTFMAIIYLLFQGRILATQKLPYGDITMTARAMEQEQAGAS